MEEEEEIPEDLLSLLNVRGLSSRPTNRRRGDVAPVRRRPLFRRRQRSRGGN